MAFDSSSGPCAVPPSHPGKRTAERPAATSGSTERARALRARLESRGTHVNRQRLFDEALERVQSGLERADRALHRTTSSALPTGAQAALARGGGAQGTAGFENVIPFPLERSRVRTAEYHMGGISEGLAQIRSTRLALDALAQEARAARIGYATSPSTDRQTALERLSADAGLESGGDSFTGEDRLDVARCAFNRVLDECGGTQG